MQKFDYCAVAKREALRECAGHAGCSAREACSENGVATHPLRMFLEGAARLSFKFLFAMCFWGGVAQAALAQNAWDDISVGDVWIYAVTDSSVANQSGQRTFVRKVTNRDQAGIHVATGGVVSIYSKKWVLTGTNSTAEGSTFHEPPVTQISDDLLRTTQRRERGSIKSRFGTRYHLTDTKITGPSDMAFANSRYEVFVVTQQEWAMNAPSDELPARAPDTVTTRYYAPSVKNFVREEVAYPTGRTIRFELLASVVKQPAGESAKLQAQRRLIEAAVQLQLANLLAGTAQSALNRAIQQALSTPVAGSAAACLRDAVSPASLAAQIQARLPSLSNLSLDHLHTLQSFARLGSLSEAIRTAGTEGRGGDALLMAVESVLTKRSAVESADQWFVDAFTQSFALTGVRAHLGAVASSVRAERMAALVQALVAQAERRCGVSQAPKVDGLPSQRESAPAQAMSPSQTVTIADPVALFQKLSPSVWTVHGEDQRGRRVSQGSGVVVAPGQIVTNCHVTEKSSRFTVRRENLTHVAVVSLEDRARDLCVLTVQGLNAPAIVVAPFSDLRVGQRVYAIGSPVGLELTLSEGLISSLRAVERGPLGRTDISRMIQTTAPISPGSSGGGLFLPDGRLIGINTFAFRDTQNVGFAVPAEWIAEIAGRAQAGSRVGSGGLAGAPTLPPRPVPRAPRTEPNSPDLPGVGSTWRYRVTEKSLHGKTGTVVHEITDVDGAKLEETTSDAESRHSKVRWLDTKRMQFSSVASEQLSWLDVSPYFLGSLSPALLDSIKDETGAGWVLRPQGAVRQEEIEIQGRRIPVTRLSLGGQRPHGSYFHLLEYTIWYSAEVKRVVRSELIERTNLAISSRPVSHTLVELVEFDLR